MKGKFKAIYGWLFAVALLALAVPAHATDPDVVGDVTAVATNAQTLFNTIVPITIAIVGFGILITVVKLVRKK